MPALFRTTPTPLPTLARVAVGLILFPHGAQHVLGWFGGYGFQGTLGWMTGTLGFPAPLAVLALVTELVAPFALVARHRRPRRGARGDRPHARGGQHPYVERVLHELVRQPPRRQRGVRVPPPGDRAGRRRRTGRQRCVVAGSCDPCRSLRQCAGSGAVPMQVSARSGATTGPDAVAVPQPVPAEASCTRSGNFPRHTVFRRCGTVSPGPALLSGRHGRPVQIVTLMEGSPMHTIVATTAAAGLAGAMIVSGPRQPAPVDSPRPAMVDSATGTVAAKTITVSDSLRAEAKLSPARCAVRWRITCPVTATTGCSSAASAGRCFARRADSRCRPRSSRRCW